MCISTVGVINRFCVTTEGLGAAIEIIVETKQSGLTVH